MNKNLNIIILFLISCLPVWAGNLEPALADLTIITDSSFSSTGMSCRSHFAACSMALCLGIPNQGQVTIQNSSSLQANNISATIPSSLSGDVSQSRVNCDAVAPGASCQITFTVSGLSSPHTLTSIPIKGSNTKTVTVEVSVDQPGC